MAGVGGWFNYPGRRIRFFAGQIPPLDLVGDLGTDERDLLLEEVRRARASSRGGGDASLS